jgi:hypothetical protein
MKNNVLRREAQKLREAGRCKSCVQSDSRTGHREIFVAERGTLKLKSMGVSLMVARS